MLQKWRIEDSHEGEAEEDEDTEVIENEYEEDHEREEDVSYKADETNELVYLIWGSRY